MGAPTDRDREIITAATPLFESRGYRNVSIQEITDSAGMSVGAFYQHFASKEELYTGIVRAIEQDGILRTDRIVSRYHSPLNKIRALYRFVTLGIRRNAILRGILTGSRDYLSPAIRRHLTDGTDIRRHVERVVVEIIREGTMKNTFRTGMYRNAPLLVSSLFEPIIKNIDSPTLDELVEDLLTLIERGLKRRLRLRRRPERLDRKLDRGLAKSRAASGGTEDEDDSPVDQ